MLRIQGAYNNAIIHSDEIDSLTETIIKTVCASPVHETAKIVIMSDVSKCRGCVIGTTIAIDDLPIIPGHIGKDSGCGLFVQRLLTNNINYSLLDEILNAKMINRVEKIYQEDLEKVGLANLHCYESIDIDLIEKSFGRIGHGNHFIEIDKNSNNELFLVIHSGSSYLGNSVLKYYQAKAFDYINHSEDSNIIRLREEFRGALKPLLFDEDELSEFNQGYLPIWYCWLDGDDKKSFLEDIDIVQKFARSNREAVARLICENLGINRGESFHCPHNYIDLRYNILHKGSISAQKGERVIIPINMKIGSIIGTGKGNPDFNYSAPHGAGKKCKIDEEINLDTFIEDMKGIHSSTISQETINEQPRTYKDLDCVIEEIRKTVEIEEIITPVFNFKEKTRDW